MELLYEWLPTLISSATAIISALVGLIVYACTARKTKLKLEEEKVKLEIEKVELEKSIINNSFIICPSCKEKIYVKDMKFLK